MSAVLQSPKVIIRPMQDDDVGEVLKIEHAMYEYPWTEGILRDCLVWVIVAGS